MYKICQTEKSIARQRELENGFLHYLETTSYFVTDVAKICRQLNIPRKTFYRYFDSKEDILYALVDHQLDDLDRFILSCNSGVSTSVRQDATSFFTFWYQQRYFLDVLQKNQLLNILMTRVLSPEYAEKRSVSYLGKKRFTPNQYVHNFLMSGIMSMMLQWHMDGFQKSIEELAELVDSLYKAPLKNVLKNYN